MILHLSLVASALLSGIGQIPVQPRTYVSISGHYELLIDPSTPTGAGPARYCMTYLGDSKWERQIPVTFLNAFVADDGSVAGYGYPTGFLDSTGFLMVVALSPDGNVRAEHQYQRLPSRREHWPAQPSALSIQGCNVGFALEVLGEHISDVSWWVYDQESGLRVASQKQAPSLLNSARSYSISENLTSMESVPLLAMTLVGRTKFPWPVPILKDQTDEASDRTRRPYVTYVDMGGRVFISESSTRIVHAFDLDGTALFDCAPHPDHFRPYRPIDWIRMRTDGYLFVCADNAIESFDPVGERQTHVPIDKASVPIWEFTPNSETHWEISTGSIAIVTSAGDTIFFTQRAPNGRWLESIFQSAVDVDGTLAVIDVPIDDSNRQKSPVFVHFFSADGTPLRSTPFPTNLNFNLYSDLGRHSPLHNSLLAVLVRNEVLIFAKDGTLVGRASLSDECSGAYLFFSPSGEELWAFPSGQAEMLRYRMPR